MPGQVFVSPLHPLPLSNTFTLGRCQLVRVVSEKRSRQIGPPSLPCPKPQGSLFSGPRTEGLFLLGSKVLPPASPTPANDASFLLKSLLALSSCLTSLLSVLPFQGHPECSTFAVSTRPTSLALFHQAMAGWFPAPLSSPQGMFQPLLELRSCLALGTIRPSTFTPSFSSWEFSGFPSTLPAPHQPLCEQPGLIP